jgi:hypothetical protein
MKEMSKEELKSFIERIPLAVSKFLQPVSNKTEKAAAAPGVAGDTKQSSRSSSFKKGIES